MKTHLSENATKLLAFLKTNGATDEGNCLEHFWPAPKYGTTDNEKLNYFQWHANYNGFPAKTTVINTPEIAPNIETPYSTQVSKAYSELKGLGLAGEINRGYDSYAFFAN